MDTNSSIDSIVRMIEQQVNTSPRALAVAAYDAVLTYGELNLWANRIAAHLQTRGVGSESLVALCMERSATFVATALGVLRTGAAYLPLDPAYPLDRLSFMLTDAEVPVVFAGSSTIDRVPAGAWHVVRADDVVGQVTLGNQFIAPNVGLQQRAYVIYTSGSTGVPKGVEVVHSNLSNLVDWHRAAFAFTSADRTTFVASPGFDAAVWEVWPSLAAGASVHVPPDAARVDPVRLRDWLITHAITVSFAPTVVAERLIELDWPARAALRILLTGGDTLRRYPRRSLPFLLVNNYGPTETTVVATSGVVRRTTADATLPNIGRAINNVDVHLLDAHLRPVSTGVVGEVWIGGAGVARGYLGRPELTVERFVPDPFSSVHGARMYRTGDLARELPTGEIAFVGRVDDQVQIRGHRIEPNEVAAALDRHPAVASSVVVARDSDGEKCLVAYVVPSGQPDTTDMTDRDLRAFLSTSLPSYMVPQTFVRIEVIPLTANGKLDRAALPAPSPSNILHTSSQTTPRTPAEAAVAATVAELLGLPAVGVEDNLFLLGGHSLLGAQLIARLRERFGVDLSLRAVFESPTVAELASVVEQLVTERVNAMDDVEIDRFNAPAQAA